MVRQLSAGPRFQIALERNGGRRTTDVPLSGFKIARLAAEAAVRDIGMVQLLSEVVATAIKKNMIKEILGSKAGGRGGRRAR
jgi:hypothetical protein